MWIQLCTILRYERESHKVLYKQSKTRLEFELSGGHAVAKAHLRFTKGEGGYMYMTTILYYFVWPISGAN